MHRRTFTAGLALSCLSWTASADDAPQEIALDGTHLRLWHRETRLHARFSAPTEGWAAVGFNNDQSLQNTRFVIGAMRGSGFHAEEHIAIGPDHPTVQALGLTSAVKDVVGEVTTTQSMMAFSLPHIFPDTANPSLRPGVETFLMLAWSHEKDFGHHSAWRRHLVLSL